MFHIPIIINNYNRLSTTRKLCKDLIKLGYYNIIILDNQSTYPPLLDWYKSLKLSINIQVIHLDKNYGQKSLWNSGLIKNFSHYEYIAYTDSDLDLNYSTPNNFIEQLVRIGKELKFDKVGLAIKIKDLPQNFMGDIIRKTESIYWVQRIFFRHYELYQGMIDTTFCIINPNKQFSFSAIRVAGDFTCRHIPWYLDFSNLSKEEQFMMDTADENISTYKQHYLEWRKNQ